MWNWTQYVNGMKACLALISARNARGADMDPDLAFSQWKKLTLLSRAAEKRVFLIGNGANASLASHIAAGLTRNTRVHTEVFSDLSLITAIANDMGYEEVFAEPIRRRMTEGDMLVAISSSGQSPSILRAVREAAALGGFVVTLSANRHDNPLSFCGMLNFYVPAQADGTAETCHSAILHHWVDLLAQEKRQKSPIPAQADNTRSPAESEHFSALLAN